MRDGEEPPGPGPTGVRAGPAAAGGVPVEPDGGAVDAAVDGGRAGPLGDRPEGALERAPEVVPAAGAAEAQSGDPTGAAGPGPLRPGSGGALPAAASAAQTAPRGFVQLFAFASVARLSDAAQKRLGQARSQEERPAGRAHRQGGGLSVPSPAPPPRHLPQVDPPRPPARQDAGAAIFALLRDLQGSGKTALPISPSPPITVVLFPSLVQRRN